MIFSSCKKDDNDTYSNSGNSNSGYNCVNGDCNAVFSNPVYLSLSDCQSDCGINNGDIIYGCTDANATNYNPSANTFSVCNYTSDVVFYLTYTAHMVLNGNWQGLHSLNFYISDDGTYPNDYIGSLNINSWWSESPDCSSSQNRLLATLNWSIDSPNSQASNTFSFRVEGNEGTLFTNYSSNFMTSPNGCTIKSLGNPL
jgi:hypothetical protein